MVTMRDLIPWRLERTPAGRRADEAHPLFNLHRQIDRLFDDMWRGFERPGFGDLERWGGFAAPRLDVTEDEKAFHVSAELPGMDEKDVEVVLTDDRLTIRGEKKGEKEESEKGRTYRERSYGSFERSFPIGSEIVADKVKAEFKKGVLDVTLPKSEEAKKHYRKIPVAASSQH